MFCPETSWTCPPFLIHPRRLVGVILTGDVPLPKPARRVTFRFVRVPRSSPITDRRGHPLFPSWTGC